MPIADTPERVAKAKQLFYTWKSCFAESVCDVKVTDLIEHFIDLVPHACPVMGKVPKYNTAERAFANEIFSTDGRCRDHNPTIKSVGSKNKISSKEKRVS